MSLLLASAASLILCIQESSAATLRSGFDTIHAGMSLPEVEVVLGLRPGIHCRSDKVIGHFEEMEMPDGMTSEDAVSEFLAFSARLFLLENDRASIRDSEKWSDGKSIEPFWSCTWTT